MKELSELLRKRWLDEGEFASLRQEITARIQSHEEFFGSRNRQQLRRDYSREDWLEQESPDRFSNYLDLYDLLKTKCPYIVDEEDNSQRLDLRGITIPSGMRGVIVRNIDFSFASIASGFQSQFIDCVFDYAVRTGCDPGILHERCRFRHMTFPRFGDMGVYLDCVFENSSLVGREGGHMCFRNCTVDKCNFQKAGMGYSHFIDSVFRNCNFRGAYLNLGTYQNTRFENCDFTNSWENFIPPGVVTTSKGAKSVSAPRGTEPDNEGSQWLGVQGSLEEFLSACARLGYTVRRGDSVNTIEDLYAELGDTGVADVLGAREKDGQLFVWGHFAPQPISADFVVRLSQELGGAVVSGMANAISGFYFLCQARAGHLLRLYYASYMTRGEAFEKGSLLSCEGLIPLDDPDGKGISLALTNLTFDFDNAVEKGPFETLIFEKHRMPTLGTLDEEAEKFFSNAPKNFTPNIQIRAVENIDHD